MEGRFCGRKRYFHSRHKGRGRGNMADGTGAYGTNQQYNPWFDTNDAQCWRGNHYRRRHGGGRTERGAGRPRSGSRERPPPGLRGRDIGMWYAKRSQTRKEKEQVQNRSSISMDKDKERNIRHLLNNLKRGEVMPVETTASNQSSGPSKQNTCESWEDLYSSDEQYMSFEEPPKQGAAASNDVKDDDSEDSNEATTIYVKVEENESEQPIKQETSNEVEDIISEQPVIKQELSNEVEEIISEQPVIKQELSNEVEENELDECFGVPSVTGVMQYMSAHSDYPYQSATDDGFLIDFASLDRRHGNPVLDRQMEERMTSLQSNSKFCRMKEFRERLPSYKMQKTIVDTINSSQVVVISGETGCGKTTQVPQFILDDYIGRGVGSQCSIICTQPRRISAISVAERVAAERCESVDATGQNSIGYQIRLETKRPRSQGSILFCTTGIVLKFLESDPKLERATHVIIDEIHERDLQSDFLMIILKDLLQTRLDLKVILMSATLNANQFSQYFNKCPMLNIPGYTFPVAEYYLEDILGTINFRPHSSSMPPRNRHRKKKPEEIEWDNNYQVWCRNQVGRYSHRVVQMLQDFDYSQINLDLVLHLIQHITSHLEDGAILVFVPGWEEIKNLNKMIEQEMRSHAGRLRVIPLHSLMPTVNQREVFDRPPPGVRKIVIATNIAETSITIDDVVYVIDCGKIKVKDFQPEMNLTSLEPQWVSKANAKQRMGRAGRVQPGKCYHLFTKFHHQMAQDYLPPEMLRTRLEELCLQIKLLKLGYIVPFISKAMQHPSMEAIQHAIQTLMDLNALDKEENLLPLGYHLARMPLEPHTAKMILFAAMFGCLDPILTVAASLSFKDAFVIPLGKEELADKARRKLANHTKSDHVMLVNAFEGWEARLRTGDSGSYCWEHFLSENTLRMLRDMKKQLAELLHDMGFIASRSPKDSKANINSHDQCMLRAILCAGLYPNVGQIIKVPGQPNNKKNRKVKMLLKDKSFAEAHPKSVNNGESFFESKWMVFFIKLRTTRVYIHDSTMVSPYPLLFFGGKIGIQMDHGQETVSVDDWMIFKASASTANLVKELRLQLDQVLKQKITNPGPTSWDRGDREGAIMTAIADLITTEQMGRGQPEDGSIGKPY